LKAKIFGEIFEPRKKFIDLLLKSYFSRAGIRQTVGSRRRDRRAG
jgi:hypothetical protein